MPKVEHIGIAPRDIDDALRVFRDLLGDSPYKVETIEKDGIQTHFVRGGGAKLELLESLGEGSAIASFLDKRGGGLHHLAFEVDDVDTALERLRALGYEPIDAHSRPGADGRDIAFLHPKQTAGMLIELCMKRRSILTERELIVGGRSVKVREAGSSDNLPFLLIGDGKIGGGASSEILAERLEQTCHVLLLEEDMPDGIFEVLDLGKAHMAAVGAAIEEVLSLSSENEPLSLSLICDRALAIPAAAPSCPVLVLAPDEEKAVASALELRFTVGGDLAVYPARRPELMAAAVEMHVRSAHASSLK